MQKVKGKKLKIFLLTILILLAFFIIMCLIFIDNTTLDFEKYEIGKKTENSQQVKIVHLSDLHFPKIKIDIDQLISKIEKEAPDIIAITGDLIDQSAVLSTSGVFSVYR
ncbi:hypothetical protein BN85405290 [Alteracholeplasma palmae J233]|uniref:Calcineurin-like phosphoesterase domain-containing protein n=1 Tax=Alteracholeplasma palmae (strain ATCC 49389 / J233) TaxID=1318466 RepID=U4KRF0_ALTPJ|nr:metallophosphoesterase [Alteracholeplasma palmae]CCV64106.1 hypothetical protein BN85405290 [Alteracholeplasma palmae J233]